MVRVIREDYLFDAPEVLSVMLSVPRHKFLPRNLWREAYEDKAVYIGFGQTMSQPYTVAKMSELILANSKLKCQNSKLGNKKHNILNTKYLIRNTRVLEIGTGSGYQAAVLSFFFDEVYTMEIVPELSHLAGCNLARLGYMNVFTKSGSGEFGWKEHAPYDAIIITAAIGKKVPKALFEQLKPGGVLVAPIGPRWSQTMTRFTKVLINDNTKKHKDKKTEKYFKLNREEFQKYVFVPFVED